MVRSRTSKKPHATEAQYTAAVAHLYSCTPDKRNYSATAKKYSVSLFTLRNRFLKKHQSAKNAHEKQKILTSPQEDVLLEWMLLHADEGQPWGKEKVKIKVEKLTSRKPSDDWVYAFQNRHKDELKFCGTSGLDPKRAQAFNPILIADHFRQLGEARDLYQYQISNIYNFDETGMQIGGGRKRTGRKYFVRRHARANYKKRDANLELVTIIECAAADGAMLNPGFIFQGKTLDMEWFKNYSNISCVVVLLYLLCTL